MNDIDRVIRRRRLKLQTDIVEHKAIDEISGEALHRERTVRRLLDRRDKFRDDHLTEDRRLRKDESENSEKNEDENEDDDAVHDPTQNTFATRSRNYRRRVRRGM